MLEKRFSEDWGKYEQGRIHGYPSRVRVGKGHNLGHQIIWAGAVKPKTKNQKKVKCDGRTDGWTDRRTDQWTDSTCVLQDFVLFGATAQKVFVSSRVQGLR